MIEPLATALDKTYAALEAAHRPKPAAWRSPADGDLTVWLSYHLGQAARVYTGSAGATIIVGTIAFVGDSSLMIGTGGSETFVMMPISDVAEVALHDRAVQP